ADLDHLTHELVTHDVAVLHRGHIPVDQVQVRAADRGGGDPYDGIALGQDLRVRPVTALDLVAARPGVRPHASAPFSSSASDSGCAGRCGNSLRARLPHGAPSERTPSPVSSTCLSRRRSSSSCWCGSSPKYLATALPTGPPGMSYPRTTSTSA